MSACCVRGDQLKKSGTHKLLKKWHIYKGKNSRQFLIINNCSIIKKTLRKITQLVFSFYMFETIVNNFWKTLLLSLTVKLNLPTNISTVGNSIRETEIQQRKSWMLINCKTATERLEERNVFLCWWEIRKCWKRIGGWLEQRGKLIRYAFTDEIMKDKIMIWKMLAVVVVGGTGGTVGWWILI